VKYILRVLALTVTLALTGCGSFNNNFNHMPSIPDPSVIDPALINKLGSDGDDAKSIPDPAPENVTAPAEHVVEKTKARCTISPYPPAGYPPELPVEQLRAVAGDVYALERLERRHIDELRAYISERRRLLRDSRKAFMEKCTTVSK
jgi:hypothetical protein